LPHGGEQRAHERADQPKKKSKKKRDAGRDSDANQQSTARNCSSTVDGDKGVNNAQQPIGNKESEYTIEPEPTTKPSSSHFTKKINI
jgi:hypothetical protein